MMKNWSNAVTLWGLIAVAILEATEVNCPSTNLEWLRWLPLAGLCVVGVFKLCAWAIERFKRPAPRPLSNMLLIEKFIHDLDEAFTAIQYAHTNTKDVCWELGRTLAERHERAASALVGDMPAVLFDGQVAQVFASLDAFRSRLEAARVLSIAASRPELPVA